MIDNTATEVRSTARAIMQDYFDPSKKVIDKRALYYAIVQALTEARMGGRQEIASVASMAQGRVHASAYLG
jgi:hypothetical protein